MVFQQLPSVFAAQNDIIIELIPEGKHGKAWAWDVRDR